MNKGLIFSAILACSCTIGLVGAVSAADKGPAEMTLQATVDAATTPKPAQFPHAGHQGRLECGTCHHGKGEDGKRVAYVEGQKIEKCETCHNSKASMPEKINTFKNAAHALCKDCHAKAKDKPELVKCTTCHKK